MPSFSRISPALMPSHVEANLINTRSLLTPESWYNLINLRPLATIASKLNDKRASTSVEIRPGTTLVISVPINTANLSAALSICSALDPPCALA